MSVTTFERRPQARRTGCPCCGVPVVEVPLRSGGLTVYVEVSEVYPRERCRTCLSGRLRDYEPRWDRSTGSWTDAVCWRCGAKPGKPGYVGEPLRGFGVAIDDRGEGVPIDLSRVEVEQGEESERIVDARYVGTAIHRAHRCRAGSVRGRP